MIYTRVVMLIRRVRWSAGQLLAVNDNAEAKLSGLLADVAK